jgi:hypothetical protein
MTFIATSRTVVDARPEAAPPTGEAYTGQRNPDMPKRPRTSNPKGRPSLQLPTS